MKGLKKIALCSAVALAPFAANAEMTALNDADMGSVTGQAGVTIDLEANVSVGEIAYKDGGFLALSGVTLGGSGLVGGTGTNSLDDIRLTIDVVGENPGTDLGVAAQATGYMTALGADMASVNSTDYALGDGDLLIGLRSQSGTPVDFGLTIGEISLNAEANASDLGDFAGSAGKGTVLVSNLAIGGAIGPVDIVVDADTQNMNINAFFNASGSLNMPFMNTTLGFELHNRRGASTAIVGGGATSFAHAQVDINPSTNGLGVNVTDFSGDLDLTNITFGTSPSIGSVYMTDLAVTATMDVYGHEQP
ncbi:DUF6160 family protein [Marinobacter confluentis]|uniref:DUF6160 domain-containing protein n=1 Tax=Marinobacter confluentis TaxID=1697557 RepID=A0A4Z1C558_9GAMM|nr:DUF6160 family protein [Marinobacter confluentis]TGN41571.1 hypothetical protein E5Q11_03295 [Marinobacter confluentis]